MFSLNSGKWRTGGFWKKTKKTLENMDVFLNLVRKRMKINYLGNTITNSKIDGEINKFESNDDIKAKYR